jgi:hypothetical protein
MKEGRKEGGKEPISECLHDGGVPPGNGKDLLIGKEGRKEGRKKGRKEDMNEGRKT